MQMEYQLAGAADNANRTHKFDCGSSKLDHFKVSINIGAWIRGLHKYGICIEILSVEMHDRYIRDKIRTGVIIKASY